MLVNVAGVGMVDSVAVAAAEDGCAGCTEMKDVVKGVMDKVGKAENVVHGVIDVELIVAIGLEVVVVVLAIVANVVVVIGAGAMDVDEEEERLVVSVALAVAVRDVVLGSTLVDTKTVRVAMDLVE